jgi:hypothetical protein
MSGAYHLERSMSFEEQSASTSRSSDRAWLMIALGLVILIVGLYWFSDRKGDQSGGSDEAVVEDQAAGEGSGDAVTIDLISSDQGNRSKPWSEDDNPPAMPISSPNERLVRRFYNEVVNQRQWAVMDELFAEDFTYRQSGLTRTRLSLAALKQQLRAESAAYVGLYYSIEQVTINEDGDWVSVDWSAGGTPRTSFNTHPPTGTPQVWSGHTDWQVVDGKLVQMWIYLVAGDQP